MKHLCLIAGPMGIGKTTAARLLSRQLPRCAFLDGDWCWDIHPFTVTEETRALVIENIAHMLNSYLRCSAVDNVVFCWVMHQQAILDDILSRLALSDVQVHPVALVCTPEELARRIQGDINAGLRQADVLSRALDRLACFASLDIPRLDVTDLSPAETAQSLADLCRAGAAKKAL